MWGACMLSQGTQHPLPGRRQQSWAQPSGALLPPCIGSLAALHPVLDAQGEKVFSSSGRESHAGEREGTGRSEASGRAQYLGPLQS